MLAPILVVTGLLSPYALALLSVLPFAVKATEVEVAQLKPRIVLVEQQSQRQEQRIDLQERILTRREILKIEDEAKRRRLSEAEKNYLEDLIQRLKELEKRR